MKAITILSRWELRRRRLFINLPTSVTRDLDHVRCIEDENDGGGMHYDLLKIVNKVMSCTLVPKSGNGRPNL